MVASYESRLFYIMLQQLHAIVDLCRALTEKIVAVLPRMKCPHRLEPHQIQGLDFIHIFPVIQVTDKKNIQTHASGGGGGGDSKLYMGEVNNS